jgi:hypothetical protein
MIPNDQNPSIWAGFYKKTLQERQDQLKLVFPQLHPKKGLPLSVAVLFFKPYQFFLLM